MEGKGANLDILCQASKWLQKSLGLQNFCFAYLLVPLQCTHVFPYCFLGHKVKGIQMFTCNKYTGNCPTKNSYKKSKKRNKRRRRVPYVKFLTDVLPDYFWGIQIIFKLSVHIVVLIFLVLMLFTLIMLAKCAACVGSYQDTASCSSEVI